MKKKIFIIMGAVVLLFAALIGTLAVKDLRQEKILREEIASIQKLLDLEQPDMDAISKKLKQTVTDGDCAKVEKAVKNYMADNFNNAFTIAEALNDEMLTSALTAENYTSDGPDFVKTKLLLGDLKKRLTEGKEKMKQLSEDEKVVSYLKDKDSYNLDVYKEFIGEGKMSAEEVKEAEQDINEILDLITAEQGVIDFLAANKGQWAVQDGTILFSDEALSDQYNQLLLELE